MKNEKIINQVEKVKMQNLGIDALLNSGDAGFVLMLTFTRSTTRKSGGGGGGGGGPQEQGKEEGTRNFFHMCENGGAVAAVHPSSSPLLTSRSIFLFTAAL